MDTLIFISIFSTLLAFWNRRRRLGVALYFVSLVAMVLLFRYHVTSALRLSF